MKFGFLIDDKAFECDGFKVAPVIDFDSILEDFKNSISVSNGWFYGPQIELVKSSSEKKYFTSNALIVHQSFFQMSSTHQITSTESYSDDHLRFLILGYGFLQGLYLTPEGYSCLGRTAYKPTSLNGLLLNDSDYINGMERINKFYIKSDEEKRNQMFACIHWYLIGQNSQFDWERFDSQYKVLDGLYRLSGAKASNHAGRPVELAKKYNLKLPPWAELGEEGKSKLSTHRNELVHEAKYGGHPIGYAYPDENYSLEFRSFNTKLIAAALGIDTPYLTSEPKNRILSVWNIKS